MGAGRSYVLLSEFVIWNKKGESSATSLLCMKQSASVHVNMSHSQTDQPLFTSFIWMTLRILLLGVVTQLLCVLYVVTLKDAPMTEKRYRCKNGILQNRL